MGQGTFGASWRLDAYNSPLSRPKHRTLPPGPSLLLLNSSQTCAQPASYGYRQPGIRISSRSYERVPLVAPTCRTCVSFFRFCCSSRRTSAAIENEGRKERSELKWRRVERRRETPSTPVAYNCQLARGYLIAIRLGGELPIWVRRSLFLTSTEQHRPRYLHDRARSA